MASDNPKPISPTAAVARHLEWLEYALAAARDEEVRRQARLGRATDKNRDKRAVRLAEVTAEVVELAALVKGIKDLRSPATPAGTLPATTRSSAAINRPAKGSKRAMNAAASSPSPASTGSPKETAATRRRAVSKTRATGAGTTAKAAATTPAGTRAASASKTATARARKPRNRTKATPAATPTAAPSGPTF